MGASASAKDAHSGLGVRDQDLLGGPAAGAVPLSSGVTPFRYVSFARTVSGKSELDDVVDRAGPTTGIVALRTRVRSRAG